MPSPKELAKALAYQGEIRNTSRNRLLGGVADLLAPVSEFADRDKLPESIPLLGGMSFADLSGLKGAQSLVNDMSYGTPPIRGASLQTAKVDPRLLDLAAVSGAMMPVGKALGKAALREGAKQIETGTGIGRAALDPRMMAVHAGGMFPGKKIPSVDTLAKVKDKFIYHSGVADDIDNMKYGIEPTNQGDWVREVASGAIDDVDNLLEQSTPLSWFSDKPDWVAAKVARKLGKNFADVTDEDIIKHGHVAMIPRKGDHASDIYKVGEEGLSNGGYSRVTNLRGEEMPAHQTDLYQENNYGQQIEPFGVERNEYITAQPVEPMFQLNGQELLDFMRKSGTRSNPSNVGGAMMQRPKPAGLLDYQIEHKPMTIEGGAAPLHDLAKSFGEDVYGKNALQYYGSGDARESGTLRLLQALRGKPDAQVTIYRGAPSEAGGINAGDWVTLDKRVAQDYVDQALASDGKAGKVFSQKVPASHITSWPDSLMEFGYHPK